MPKCFSIDFVRQAFEQKLFMEHIINENYFGGKDQVNIFSFYEQLKSQDEIDRFVENYRDLTEQQNRSGLILNGVILAPENPSITNLYSSTIIPMTWTCSMRCTLANRDNATETIDNLINQLKGRKVDIAELKCRDMNNHICYKPFMVGTIGQNFGAPTLKSGDYIGYIDFSGSSVVSKLLNYFNELELTNNDSKYLYCENDNKLKVILIDKGDQFEPIETTILGYTINSRDYITKVQVKLKDTFQQTSVLRPLYNANSGSVELLMDNETSRDVPCSVEITKYELVDGYPEITIELTLKDRVKDEDIDSITSATCELYYKDYEIVANDGTHLDIPFPPEHESFTKWKVSFSFDAIRCDEPRNLNAEEYCEISFSGSATLVNESVQLGNDLIKISAKKLGINAKTPINLSSTSPTWYLEPLEMPSGNEANTNPLQLASNMFKTNSHTDAISLSLQYTFIYDKSNSLLKQLFEYGRYGTQGLTVNDISPNMIFEIKEIWSSWGELETKTIKAKLVESIDIENTESDTLTLSLIMQIQGDNN